MRQLKSFNISRSMLRMLYESVVDSASFNAVVCWGSRPRVVDANRQTVKVDPLMVVLQRKVKTILWNGSNLLHDVLTQLRGLFSGRLNATQSATERQKKIISACGNQTPHCQCLTLRGSSGSELFCAITSYYLILALCTAILWLFKLHWIFTELSFCTYCTFCSLKFFFNSYLIFILFSVPDCF